MKTQFNFTKITLTVVLFFSLIFTSNLKSQMTVLTNISNYNGYNVSCYGMNNGWITLTPVNAQGNVTYQWSNGDTTFQSNNLPAGRYEILVSDTVSTVQLTLDLNEPLQLNVHLIPFTTTYGYNLKCYNDNSGAITARATGGTGKLLYNWSNGSNYVSQRNLSAGSYTLTVTDDNGCMVVENETLVEPDPVSVTTLLMSETSSCVAADGIGSAYAIGGQGGYNFLWDNNERNAYTAHLTTGLHIVKAWDSYGCSNKSTLYVTSADGMTAPVGTLSSLGGNVQSTNDSRLSSIQPKPAILNNDIKNEGVMIQNVENFQENSLLISDMMGNVRVQLQNVKSVSDLNVNLERGHYVAVLVYRNENGEMESVTNQISIR